MRSAQVAALAVALALLAGDNFGAWCAGVARAGATDVSDEEEGDSAPFMVVVRHVDGRACGAALVSLRTALSSAECARGAGDLWAVAAAGAGSARRVVRVAIAAGGDGTEAGARDAVAGDPWAGADADLALLELAAPLPSARAILMATDPADCEPPQGCHLVRLVRTPPAPSKGSGTKSEGGLARLRIVDAQLEEGGTCAARGPRWSALRARTLCLSGPELCQGDRGTGVVCGGKLCGVVSRSAGATAPGDLCGDAHAAASVPRWRRFLHCAHTRGACGRDGDCARLCSERWLVDAPPEVEGAAAVPSRPAPPVSPALLAAPRRGPPPADALQLGSAVSDAPGRTDRVIFISQGADTQPEAGPPRTEPAPAPAPAPEPSSASPARPAAAGLSPRGAFEFEPNRADFKMSAATARVFLKAGEYGDNGAEYVAPEDSGPVAGSTPPAAVPTVPHTAAVVYPSRTPAPGAAPAHEAEVAARVHHPQRKHRVAPDRPNTASRVSTTVHVYAVLMCTSFIVIVY